MSRSKLLPLFVFLSVSSGLLLLAGLPAQAQLAIGSQFNPANEGGLCGLGFDSSVGEVWAHGCSESDVGRYSAAGAFLSAVTRPGESADDVDVELAPSSFPLGATTIPAHTLLFINGETGPAEIYALDKTFGTNLATLNADFGVSHVVGGAYHPGRQTLFLVQDRVPVAASRNRIAEIDPGTGSVLNTFQIEATFSVNFGDLEVCSSTGNLLVASSAESRLAEYSPTGSFIAYHDLPVGVSSLSGIAIDESSGDIWVGGTGGNVWRLTGGPCGAAPAVPASNGPGTVVLTLALISGGLLWSAARRTGSA